MTEQMESERKIEKLLRAYAKKRRAQAGDPLELHPATRRLLQGEVACKAPKPDEEDASMTLWELFRQRWAFLLGFALIIFFGASLFLPALSSAKKKAQTVTTMSNLKQIGIAAQMAAGENNGKLPASLDALTNQLVSDKILTDTESGKRFIYVAGGENLAGLPSNSVLAYSPTDKKGRAVLFADGSVVVINDAQFSELTNRGLPELALAKESARRQFTETPAEITLAGGNAAAAPSVSGQLKSDGSRNEPKLADSGIAVPRGGELAANAPAVPATAINRLGTAHGAAGNYSSIQTKSVPFASTASPNLALSLQNSFRNTTAPDRAVSVLANFKVEQNGNAIRVVDADGSVYDGSLQPESAVAQNGASAAAAPAPTQVERAKTAANKDESQTVQNYFFRVSGTNQTLKQNVVFTGNLLAMASTTTNLQQSISGSAGFVAGAGGFGGGRLQPALTNQLPWSSSRITGTAMVAGTNNIEINAVPLSP
jgi:hypothetical protein